MIAQLVPSSLKIFRSQFKNILKFYQNFMQLQTCESIKPSQNSYATNILQRHHSGLQRALLVRDTLPIHLQF